MHNVSVYACVRVRMCTCVSVCVSVSISVYGVRESVCVLVNVCATDTYYAGPRPLAFIL